MAASIDQLKGLVSSKAGFAKPNVFKVILPSIGGISSGEVNLLCSGANLPGRQIMTQEKKIGLINQKVAYDQAFDDVTLTFRVLNDYGIRNYFEKWQNLAINQNTLEVGYLNEYSFNVTIQQLKKGIGLPVYSTPLGIPKLPANIQNRLPRIGPFDLAQGELDLNFVTKDDVVYECQLLDAFPTTLNAIQLGDGLEEQILELSIQLSYRNWVNTNVNTVSGTKDFVNSLFGTVLDRIL